MKGGLVIDSSRPWEFPLKLAKADADHELLVQRQVHEVVQHLPAPGPDVDQVELDDEDLAALDYEQQLWSEADDPVHGDEDPPSDEVLGVVDESLLGLDPVQTARRLRDDAGIWPPRTGSSRPPNIHPDIWQSLSHAVRRELAADYRAKTAADTAPKDHATQTGAMALLEVCTDPASTFGAGGFRSWRFHLSVHGQHGLPEARDARQSDR